MTIYSLLPSYGSAKYGKVTSSSDRLSFSKTLQNTSNSSNPTQICGKGMTINLSKDTVGSGYDLRSGFSYSLKYAPESTEDDPIMIAYGVDENQQEYQKTIHIKDIDPCHATYIEFLAFGTHYKIAHDSDRPFLFIPKETMTLNSTHNFLSLCEDTRKDQQILGNVQCASSYEKMLSAIQNILSKQKKDLEQELNYLLSLNRRI